MLFPIIQSKDIRKQLAVIFRLCVCSTVAPCILAVKDTPTAQLGNADHHTPYFYLCTLSFKSVKIGIIYSDILVFSLVYISSKDGLSLSKVYIQNITILYYFDKVAIFKCVRVVYLLVLISLVINAILFIQTDCNAHTNTRGGIYRMNQSQPSITSHAHYITVEALPLVWLSPIHSQLPPTKLALGCLLKLNGLRGGKKEVDSCCNFTCSRHCWKMFI